METYSLDEENTLDLWKAKIERLEKELEGAKEKDLKEIKNLLKVILILIGQEHGLTKEELESLVNKPIGDISVG